MDKASNPHAKSVPFRLPPKAKRPDDHLPFLSRPSKLSTLATSSSSKQKPDCSFTTTNDADVDKINDVTLLEVTDNFDNDLDGQPTDQDQSHVQKAINECELKIRRAESMIEEQVILIIN